MISTNLLLYFLELYGLSLLLIGLHRISSKYGIASFLFVLAATVGVLQAPGTNAIYIDTDEIRLVISPTVLVPCVLMSLLIVYIVDGTAAARLVIGGVLLTSLSTLLAIQVLAMHLALPGGGTLFAGGEMLAEAKPSFRLMFASLTSLTISMTLLLVIYQLLAEEFPVSIKWLAPGIALMFGLAVDGVVFSWIYIGRISSMELVYTKVMAGLLLVPVMYFYLRSHKPHVSRKPLDVMFGSYGQQDLRLRRSQQAIKTAQIRLETVVGNTPLILFALDSKGAFTWVEGAGLNAIGCRSEDMLGYEVAGIFNGASDLVAGALQNLDQDGLVTVNNRVLELCLRPRVDDDLQIIEVDGVATDVTERREVETELRASEVRFEATFDNAAVGLSLLDANGRFIRVNERLCELVAIDESTLLQLTLREVVKDEYRKVFDQEVSELIDGNLVSSKLELKQTKGDGLVVDTVVTLSAALDDQGCFEYLIAVIEDVTERKLTEQKLSEAQKLKAVGQLTGGIAHDFNNLLTVVMGGLEIAISTTKDDQIKALLEPAFKATTRGADLTQRLLAYSRRQPLRSEVVDLPALLDDLKDILVRSLPTNIEIAHYIGDSSSRCLADPSQLQNVVLNLALNARDAMPDGGKLVITVDSIDMTYSNALELEAGDYVRIEVADTGVGMSKAVLEKVYEPFYTTKDVGKGSGLGLSMIYGFVKQSNGAVEIQSEVNFGTKVTLYLPGLVSNSEGPSSVKPEEAASEEGGGETILLIEDDPDVLALVCKQLRHLNYAPIAAETGRQGLSLLESGLQPVLMISDVMLPGGMNGAAVVEAAHKLYPNLPVILTSGYSRDVLSGEHQISESVEILPKPYRMDQLSNAIRHSLGKEA